MTFEPTSTCGLISRHVTCFGTVGHACAMKYEKCEEDKAYVLRVESFDDVSAVSNHTECSFLKTTTRLICFVRHCCSLSYSSFSCDADFTALWLHLRSLSSLPFLRQALSFFPRFQHNFCHFDVETMRPLVQLQHWLTFCKQDILIAFLKQDRSQGHTPPTKNTYCKISSLVPLITTASTSTSLLPFSMTEIKSGSGLGMRLW